VRDRLLVCLACLSAHGTLTCRLLEDRGAMTQVSAAGMLKRAALRHGNRSLMRA